MHPWNNQGIVWQKPWGRKGGGKHFFSERELDKKGISGAFLTDPEKPILLSSPYLVWLFLKQGTGQIAPAVLHGEESLREIK